MTRSSSASAPPIQSVIAAVGRSGTTIIHRLLLEIYADCFGKDFDCLYEPFVWDSDVVGLYPLDKSKEALFQGRDAMSEEGMFLHTQIPLFAETAGPRPEVESLTASYLKAGGAKPLVGKFIRANGRLGLLDKLYPEGRFLLVLRNPLDVVNSVVTMFSFYGAEFHRNDFPRFAAQVLQIFGVQLPPERDLSPAYKAALWVHFMNLAALKHAAGRENYKIIVYEDFAAHREAYTRDICAHLGFAHKPAYDIATAAPVGRIAKGPPALSAGDVAQLMPIFEQYVAMVAALPTKTSFDTDRVLRKYANLPAHGNYDAHGLGWSPARLERELFQCARNVKLAAAGQRARIAEVQRRTVAAEIGARSEARSDARGGAGISVIITSFNNAATLRRAIDSVRAQSFPVSEIIVADDGSTDQSRELLAATAATEPRLRLLLREQTMGAGASGNDAVRQARHVLFCQLDGADVFHPAKIEREMLALQGCTESVAFSDTIKLDPEEYRDTSWLAGLNGSDAVVAMVSRSAPLPRDMLTPVDLFLKAGGFTQGLYSDWGLNIRLAEKARRWLYSGGEGTLQRSGDLSRVARVAQVHSALCVLCNDAADIIARHQGHAAALAGLLKIMRINVAVDPAPEGPVQTALGVKLSAIFDEIRSGLLDKPAEAYAGNEKVFFDRLHQLFATIGLVVR